jgi:hypothetical protein
MKRPHEVQPIAHEARATTLAGQEHTCRCVDGPADLARFLLPADFCTRQTNLVIADGNHRICVLAGGHITTLAPFRGAIDKKKSDDSVITSVCWDARDNVLLAGRPSCLVRISGDEGECAVVAGHPKYLGYRDGSAQDARFHGISGIVIDSTHRIVLAEDKNRRIRYIEPRKQLEETLKSTTPELALFPPGLVELIVSLVPHEVKTLAGGSNWDTIDGEGATARFRNPCDITLGPDDCVFVADKNSYRIRKVTRAGVVSTVWFLGRPRPNSFSFGVSVAYDFATDTLYACDHHHNLYCNVKGIVSRLQIDPLSFTRIKRIRFDADRRRLLVIDGHAIKEISHDTLLKSFDERLAMFGVLVC